jgi:hypothetical protein
MDKEREDLVELALTEGARRNIAMAHIIKERKLRATLADDKARFTELLDWLWDNHPDIADEWDCP